MKKYLVPLIAVIVAIVSCIIINIYNTAALSPLGNTESNYEIVSSEFGKDFSEFIKDKSPIKIYMGELGDNEAVVKILGKDINLTKDNVFLRGIKPLVNYVSDTISSITDKLGKKSDNNSEDVINQYIDEFNNEENNGEKNSQNIKEKEENTKEESNTNEESNTKEKFNAETSNTENNSELNQIIDDFINDGNSTNSNGE